MENGARSEDLLHNECPVPLTHSYFLTVKVIEHYVTIDNGVGHVHIGDHSHKRHQYDPTVPFYWESSYLGSEHHYIRAQPYIP